MTRPVSIRRPLAEDRQAWEALWQGYLAFYQESDLDPAITEDLWRKLTTPDGDVFGYVAEAEGGQLVGLVHYLFHAGTWTLKSRSYLEDLFVVEAARGLGAGRALIEAVAKDAKARGAGRVYWHTHDHNETARKLYDRIGTFVPFVRYDLDL